MRLSVTLVSLGLIGASVLFAASELPWVQLLQRLPAWSLIAATLVLGCVGAAVVWFARYEEPAMMRVRRGAVKGLVILAAVTVPAGMWVGLAPQPVRRWVVATFGPPRVTMNEAYADGAEMGAVFDPAGLDRLLRQHVSEEGGWVDYAGLARDAAALDAYIASLAEADLERLGRDERLALLINAYNAFTIRLILDHNQGGRLASIFEIPEDQRWDVKRWSLAGRTVSLNQIEHEWIRPKFSEPRIHFALVCAAVGCPPLRHEAYTGEQLEAQLADQSRYVHTHDRWLRFDAKSRKLQLTQLYEWYADDFTQVAGSVVAYVATQSPAVAAVFSDGQNKIDVSYLDYSWKLNDVRNRP